MMRNVIFMEMHTDHTILKSSRLFCGCCGHQVGTMKENISFPFKAPEIIKMLDDCSLGQSPFGIHHMKCGALLSIFGGGIMFHPLRELFNQTLRKRETDKLIKLIPDDEE